MKKRNPEVRLLMKILAIIGFVILFLMLAGYVFLRVRAPQLLEFSKGVTESRISIKLDSLDGASFIAGMSGCENILPVNNSTEAYVSCLDGYIHILDADSAGIMAIRKSARVGNAVMGLSLDPEGNLIAAICDNDLKEWRSKGGSLYQLSRDLDEKQRISEDFPSMNGICTDRAGNIYFASSNFNFFHPLGTVYRMNATGYGLYGSPEPAIRDAGLANGLYYDRSQDLVFFSNTIGGVYELTPGEDILEEVYLKLRFMEACDDLCTDISGNIWMTDPGQSTVKIFNPGTGRLVRFVVEGIGQTSSCRIRSENGLEMLYITELKQKQQPMSETFDGRGVLVVPAQSLLKQLEPIN